MTQSLLTWCISDLSPKGSQKVGERKLSRVRWEPVVPGKMRTGTWARWSERGGLIYLYMYNIYIYICVYIYIIYIYIISIYIYTNIKYIYIYDYIL